MLLNADAARANLSANKVAAADADDPAANALSVQVAPRLLEAIRHDSSADTGQ